MCFGRTHAYQEYDVRGRALSMTAGALRKRHARAAEKQEAEQKAKEKADKAAARKAAKRGAYTEAYTEPAFPTGPSFD